MKIPRLRKNSALPYILFALGLPVLAALTGEGWITRDSLKGSALVLISVLPFIVFLVRRVAELKAALGARTKCEAFRDGLRSESSTLRKIKPRMLD